MGGFDKNETQSFSGEKKLFIENVYFSVNRAFYDVDDAAWSGNGGLL